MQSYFFGTKNLETDNKTGVQSTAFQKQARADTFITLMNDESLDKTIRNDYPESPKPKSSLKESALDDVLRAAVYEVGPRVYNVDLKGKSKVRILFIGCPGYGKGKDKKSNQEKVAELLNNLYEIQDENTYTAIVGLGDYVYDYGVAKPSGKPFDDYFHNIYDKKRRILLGLGNHDASLCEKAFYYNKYVQTIPMGDAVSINEVAHTYDPTKRELSENDFNLSTEERDKIQRERIRKQIAILKQDTIDLEDPDAFQSQWIMPFFFDSYIFGDTQLFILDSNSFAKDFFDYCDNKIDPKKPNQFEWLLREYTNAKEAGRKIVFGEHQFLDTDGKRLEKPDSHHYTDDLPRLNNKIKQRLLIKLLKSSLSEEHWAQFQPYATTAPSYENLLEQCKKYFSDEQIDGFKKSIPSDSNDYFELVGRIFDTFGFEIDFLACAHDHYIRYFNNKQDPNAARKICQLTCGGGGGRAQEQKSLLGYPYATTYPGYSDDDEAGYGVGELIFDASKPQEFQINIRTLKNNMCLSFSDKDHLPRYNPENNPDLELLRQQVLIICHEFLAEKRAQELAAKKREIKSGSYSLLQYIPYFGSGKNETPLESGVTDSYISLSQLGSLFKPLKPIVKPIVNLMGLGDCFHKELKCVNNLFIYFQQSVTPSMEKLVDYLQKTLSEMPAKDVEGSLYLRFKNSMDCELLARCGIEFERSRTPVLV